MILNINLFDICHLYILNGIANRIAFSETAFSKLLF